MKVSAMMTTPAVTIRADATFTDIVDKLMENDVSGLPVVDHEGHLVGVVTEADLVSKDAYGSGKRRPLGLVADYLRGRDPQWVRKAAGHSAAELMTARPDVASPDDDVHDVALRMLEHHHKRLPVVDRAGHVLGIVSRHDLLRPFHRPDTEIKASIVALLADSLSVPESHEAKVTVTNGLVTLHGTTRWQSDAAIIESAVGRLPGVFAVQNELTAREPEPHFSTPL